MSRSSKKGPYVDEKLLKKIQNLKRGDNTVIKTLAIISSISPEMVGFTIGVHDGRQHIPVLVVEDMVGHKLGEFAPTRKFIRHGGWMGREEAKSATQKEVTKTSEEPKTETKEK